MSDSTSQLVAHFFRHESANVIAVLTRAFGIRRLPMIEDMVQVAMLEAMDSWKHQGIPDRPAAWVHRVATQRIIDELRREQAFLRAVERSGHSVADQQQVVEAWFEDSGLGDSLLRMMFVCCHPLLDRAAQIALTLKTLCGFGVPEVASALLLPEETVRKRIQRARKALADANISVSLPSGEELIGRRVIVHDVLYLMFNEGYSTTRGYAVIRDDVCEEALRLCHLLSCSEVAGAETRALLALLMFQSSRLSARVDSEGLPVLLEDQDRRQWDRALIKKAQATLLSTRCEVPGVLHLEAAIAMQHSLAVSVPDTNWDVISSLYERLLILRPSPLYRLNHAVALGESGRTEEALRILSELRVQQKFRNYPYVACAMARLYVKSGDLEAAIQCYQDVLSSNIADHQRRFVESRLRLTGEL